MLTIVGIFWVGSVICASFSCPSEEDKRLAYDPTVNYLILSLMDRDQPVLKAFDIDKEKNVTIEELVIQ